MSEQSEIEDIVARANAEVADQPDPEPEPEKKPATKKRSRKTNGSRAKSKEPPTIEELEREEAAEALLQQPLPKPAREVKGLEDMYAKYGVGDHPEFKMQVWRTYPKLAPGGKKFDGFYDTWDTPLTMEQIQAEYGGGQYRIAVVGPHPSNPRRIKQYDSIPLSLAGDPVWERVPNALKGSEHKSDGAADNPPPHPMMMQPPEATKLSEVALKMMQDTADKEREERRRVEDREERRRQQAGESIGPVIEAERRRADDVLAAERRSSDYRERMMNERLEEERRARQMEREETRRRMQELETRPQPSVAGEIEKLARAGLLGGRDDGGAVREMLTQILEKHRGEMTAMQQQHTQFVESLRTGHGSEVQAIRDAHRRELEAERDASRAREARIDERLQAEREERRRDQDRFREQVEQRDQQWRDRMEQATATLQSSWESRHQALTSTWENRVQWLQQENDRLRGELGDMKLKTEEKGDIFAQLHKYREFSTVLKEMSGSDSSSSSSTPSSGGGIGLSGDKNVPPWMEMLAESPVAEKVVERLFGGGQTQAVPPQQQYQEGQIVPTPQGEMVVVRNPADGQLALAPKQAFEAHQRAVQEQAARGGGLLDPRQQQRRGSRRAAPAKQRQVSVVPNLGEGLPKRRPPWEGGGHEEPLIPPPPTPRPAPRMTTRSAAPAAAPSDEPMQLSSIERQGLNMIAKLVHESVQVADDADEFVAKVMNAYPPDVLKQIVMPYSIEDIVRGIHQVQPNSAGATPAGQQFVREAFKKLRLALR